MAKNKKVMSLAIDPALHEQLKDYTERKDVSTSAYLGDLITKAIQISVDDEPIVYGKPPDSEVLPVVYKTDSQVLPVVFKIPVAMRGNREALSKWLAEQNSRLLAKLG